MLQIKAILIVLASVSQEVFASNSSHGEVIEVPGVVFYQALNAGIFFLGLFLILRPHIKKYFTDRKKNFDEAKQRAENLLEEAQQSHTLLTEKLLKLERESKAGIEKARAEAAEMGEEIIKEAQRVSERIKREGARTADREISLAKEALRKEMLEKALQAAEEALSEQLSGDDKTRLQKDFCTRVEAMRP